MKIVLDDLSLKAIRSLYYNYSCQRDRIWKNDDIPEEIRPACDSYLKGRQETILEVLDMLGIIYQVDEDSSRLII